MLNNPFAPIEAKNLGPQLKPIEFEKERLDVVLIPKAQEVDADNAILVYEPVIKGKTNINDLIASYADDVGIQNILRKVALSGDTSLFNQTGRKPLGNGGPEPVQDYTDAPQSKTDAFNQVVKGVQAFDELPADLKGKMSMAQFAELVGQEEFENYIAGIIAKNTPKEESK